jgi:hypothetical protein
MALLDNVLQGLYIGVMTGVFTALLVFGTAFTFQYVAGVNFPPMYGLIIGLGSAGLQGGIRAFIRDPELLRSSTAVVALLVVMLISLYAHKKGQALGKALPPKRVLLGGLRRRALSPDVVRQIGRFGQVRVRTVGEVGDMEGYLPLPEEIRTDIRGGEWTFPADLPMAELETRLAEKLKTEHDLEDVAVSIDAQARATVSAAPPASALSRRVPEGTQVVAVDAAVPAGLARGDEVALDMSGTRVTGTVVSAATDAGGDADEPPASKAADTAEADPEAETEGEGVEPVAPAASDAVQTGGSGRVALAVDPGDVSTVVGTDVSRLVVRSRGRNREYELVSLLRRDGNGFAKLRLRGSSPFVDRRVGDVRFRDEHGVAVLAIKRADEWLFAPGGATALRADDELFVTGPGPKLDALKEAAA